MLTNLLSSAEKSCKYAAFAGLIKCSSPVRVTILQNPAISTGCGVFLTFQGFSAFKCKAACLISKHKKLKENEENANRNAKRAGRQYEADIKARERAPPDLRKELTEYV